MSRAIMIQGCTSDAGKSYLAAALCRILSNFGMRVTPFKAQNMSNNAGVTPDGLEMGRAQLVQAAAARVIPDVRMNPVLLKPQADTQSQVVVLGKVDHDLTALPWRERKALLWNPVQDALHSLMNEYDVVVIEGAGSPAEINLRESDIVNMRIALEVNAQVLLVADIDRGGAFAHLLGTWHCFSPQERALLRGFVLNRFRGDASLLSPAPEWLQQQTEVPVVGIVPWLPIPLPEEDQASLSKKQQGGLVGIIALPHLSNFDEFADLGHHIRWIRYPAQLADVHAIILPGSKATASDLDWLKQTGLAGEISRLARAGTLIFGICGGMQMLGKTLSDDGIEQQGTVNGLGLLDLHTTMSPIKQTTLTAFRDPETGYWLKGYEIHHGQTRADHSEVCILDGKLWRQGNVRGTYIHGLLQNPAYLEQFLAWAGLDRPHREKSLDSRLDAIADKVQKSFAAGYFERLIHDDY